MISSSSRFLDSADVRRTGGSFSVNLPPPTAAQNGVFVERVNTLAAVMEEGGSALGEGGRRRVGEVGEVGK